MEIKCLFLFTYFFLCVFHFNYAQQEETIKMITVRNHMQALWKPNDADTTRLPFFELGGIAILLAEFNTDPISKEFSLYKNMEEVWLIFESQCTPSDEILLKLQNKIKKHYTVATRKEVNHLEVFILKVQDATKFSKDSTGALGGAFYQINPGEYIVKGLNATYFCDGLNKEFQQLVFNESEYKYYIDLNIVKTQNIEGFNEALERIGLVLAKEKRPVTILKIRKL